MVQWPGFQRVFNGADSHVKREIILRILWSLLLPVRIFSRVSLDSRLCWPSLCVLSWLTILKRAKYKEVDKIFAASGGGWVGVWGTLTRVYSLDQQRRCCPNKRTKVVQPNVTWPNKGKLFWKISAEELAWEWNRFYPPVLDSKATDSVMAATPRVGR